MSSVLHIDVSMLDGLKELLADNFVQLISAYISDGTERLSRLSHAMTSVDLPNVTMESHALKGSSKNIGAEYFAEICGALEQQARAGNAENFEQKFAAIEQEFAVIVKELQPYLS